MPTAMTAEQIFFLAQESALQSFDIMFACHTTCTLFAIMVMWLAHKLCIHTMCVALIPNQQMFCNISMRLMWLL